MVAFQGSCPGYTVRCFQGTFLTPTSQPALGGPPHISGSSRGWALILPWFYILHVNACQCLWCQLIGHRVPQAGSGPVVVITGVVELRTSRFGANTNTRTLCRQVGRVRGGSCNRLLGYLRSMHFSYLHNNVQFFLFLHP